MYIHILIILIVRKNIFKKNPQHAKYCMPKTQLWICMRPANGRGTLLLPNNDHTAQTKQPTMPFYSNISNFQPYILMFRINHIKNQTFRGARELQTPTHLAEVSLSYFQLLPPCNYSLPLPYRGLTSYSLLKPRIHFSLWKSFFLLSSSKIVGTTNFCGLVGGSSYPPPSTTDEQTYH